MSSFSTVPLTMVSEPNRILDTLIAQGASNASDTSNLITDRPA
ncbi:MAG: hypothetical protein AAGE61_17245 [Pseudomonadota bacterium]